MHVRQAVLAATLSLVAISGFAQSGGMLTEEAFIATPGKLTLDVFGQTIGKEPNFQSFLEKRTLQLRTRVDGPMFRLSYAASKNAQFEFDFNAQTYAIKDPRYLKTVSDVGDSTLRAKLGLAQGEEGVSPAVAFQFQVTLPHTSYGNGLGPNTISLEGELLVSYKNGPFAVHGNAGIAIQDEPARAHEQRDFVSLQGAVSYAATDNIEVFADAGGYLGEGVAGAIARREARAGVNWKMSLGGRDAAVFVAGRRGLVDFQGKWGVVAGLSVALRPGAEAPPTK